MLEPIDNPSFSGFEIINESIGVKSVSLLMKLTIIFMARVREMFWHYYYNLKGFLVSSQQPRASGILGSGRLPAQHKYDPGQKILEDANRLVLDLCQRYQQPALRIKSKVFACFQKTNQHLTILMTIRRADNQYGFRLHNSNQYWRQGFCKEAVRAVLISGLYSSHLTRIEA